MSPGVALGLLAVVGGGGWWYTHQHAAADAGTICFAQDRASAVRCFTLAAGDKQRVRAACQVALDLVYKDAGGTPAAPTPGLAGDANTGYLALLYQPQSVTYADAVHTLDLLWQQGAYYEASFTVAAIATEWGSAS